MAKKQITSEVTKKTGSVETSLGNASAVSVGKSRGMKSFEERLERLEMLGEKIRKTDIPLDDALKAFEEGIRLAQTLEKDLEKIESRIEILMNSTEAPPEESPELDLFNTDE